LRSLEYRVMRLEVDPQGRTGGAVRFMRTPLGRWVITSWKTRVPTLSRETGRDELIGFQEVGGRVSWIATPTGEFVYRAPFAELHGTVVDEQAAPVAGVTVRLVGTRHTTETDSAGQFTFSGSLDGEYTVSSRYSTIDTLLHAPTVQRVSLVPGRSEQVRVEMPAFDAIVRPLCADQPHRPGQRIVTGVVRAEQGGTVLDSVRVVAVTGAIELSTVTDSAGFYAICGLPLSVPVDIWAEDAGKAGNTVTLQFDDAGVNRYVRLRSGAGSQSEYRRTTSTIWVEDFQLAQLSALPRMTRSSIGFKLGGTYSTITGSGIDADASGGLQLGAFYEAQFREQVAVQIEGRFAQQGAFSPLDGRTMRLYYLRLPILAKFRLSGDTSRPLMPYVFGGPAFGIEMRGFKGVLKGDFSVVLGGGVSIGTGAFSILADAAYDVGLTPTGPPPLRKLVGEEVLEPENFFFEARKFKNRLLSFSLGLSFPLGRKIDGAGGGNISGSRSLPRGDIITREEIAATNLVTAYEVVQYLHPQWLRGRGTGQPIVYVNSTQRGNPGELRLIMAESIAEIVYFNGRDASLRFGSGHASGVIQVIIGR
jgi:hypothetical protein